MISKLIVLAILGSLAPATATQAGDAPHVGVLDDPCAALEPMPPVIADYMVRYKAALAAGDAPPLASAEGMALYAAWQQRRLLQDFPGLCRYRAENESLSATDGNRIVFFGDSITELWQREDPAFFNDSRIDRGISGQTTQQMIGRFQADVIALKPSVVHIIAGTNDIAGNTGPTSLRAIEDNIASMVELAKAHGIRVVIGAVPPASNFDWRPEIEPVETIKALNVWLKEYAAEEGHVFIDSHQALVDDRGGFIASLSDDGVHPNRAGYAVMREVLSKSMRRD